LPHTALGTCLIALSVFAGLVFVLYLRNRSKRSAPQDSDTEQKRPKFDTTLGTCTTCGRRSAPSNTRERLRAAILETTVRESSCSSGIDGTGRPSSKRDRSQRESSKALGCYGIQSVRHDAAPHTESIDWTAR
jgi:hypothetical protein